MSADSSPAALVGVDSSAGSTNNKRFRHFWEGPKAVAEHGGEEETTQGSPVARLYQHALESVFGFLSLADLSHALNVSRSWSHAVRVMPCARLSVCCTVARLLPLCFSALSKHVSSVRDVKSVKSELPLEAVDILARRMPQLRRLQCIVLPSEAMRLILPPRLHTLQLGLSRLEAATINTIINGISQLTALVTLELTLPSLLGISFAPLTAVASLRDLELSLNASHPTDEQLDQLRALPQLRKMDVDWLSSQSLAELLRTPHDLHWQQIHRAFDVDAVVSAALSSLPSLTTLKTLRCTDIGFLPHLVQLRTLELHIPRPWPATITADAVVAGLSCCAQLTDLTLTAPLNSKHLSALLPRLPLLTKLCFVLMRELESLSCLSSGPIVHRLRSLDLYNCNNDALRSSELQHVYALTALEDLCIMESFARERFSSLERWLHTPPSKLMPQLKCFRYRQLDDEDEGEDEDGEDEDA